MVMHVVYETTNLENGKIYIGVHRRVKDPDDYLGSGTLLTRAIKKHGRSKFRRVILHEFESSDEAYAKERELVTDEFIANRNTYNLKRGGLGGFTKANGQRLVGKFGKEHPASCKRSNESCQRISIAKKGMTFSDEHRKNLSIAKIGSSASSTTREKMSLSSRRHTSKKIEYLGKTYSSIVEAERLAGVSRYLLLKHGLLL